MLAAAGYGHGVQHFKEIETQHAEKTVRCPLLRRKFGPVVVSPLCLSENVIKGTVSIKQVIHTFYLTLVCELKLILQVIESVVDRRCRQHQHLCLYTGLNDLVHQLQIAVLSRIAVIVSSGYLSAVAEVMGLVNYYQVVIAPVDILKLLPICFSGLA